MNWHLLHNLSGTAIFLSLMIKIAVHFYLDYLHGRRLGFYSIFMMPFQYLVPYKSAVNKEYKRMKNLCNSLIIITYISLLLNIISGVMFLF